LGKNPGTKKEEKETSSSESNPWASDLKNTRRKERRKEERSVWNSQAVRRTGKTVASTPWGPGRGGGNTIIKKNIRERENGCRREKKKWDSLGGPLRPRGQAGRANQTLIRENVDQGRMSIFVGRYCRGRGNVGFTGAPGSRGDRGTHEPLAGS